jgi:hypothetical protein
MWSQHVFQDKKRECLKYKINGIAVNSKNLNIWERDIDELIHSFG